jgi:hypothetical protein
MTRPGRPAPKLVSAVLLVASLALGREAAAQSCDADHTIAWPDSNPVWQICWVSAENSSGIDGSGLEIASVYYNGKKVLQRGHVPVLNVKYDPGGCGGSDLSYRDWANELAPFEADNVIRPGYAEPTGPPQTVCDHPGTDVGTFEGVAAEKLTDRLILTTQLRAGWYRYIQTWTFFLDGTFQPGFRFTAVDNTCTPLAHYHNVYWRLDFDLEGSANDAIDEYDSGTWSALTTEGQRLQSPGTGRKWRVWDKATGSGYEMIPAPEDEAADSWSVGDVWALAYRSSELDDGGATGGSNGDRAHLDQYMTGESIDGRDVVFWYRAGFRHDGPADCEIAGPTVQPIQMPPAPPTLSIGDVTVTEGNAGTTNALFTVSLSAASNSTVTVNYATADGTATAGSDYVAGTGTLTFPPGTTSQTLGVAVNGDTAIESAETFFVNLHGASNATITDGQGQGTILNDDKFCLPLIGCP